jgi:hypothetical protein
MRRQRRHVGCLSARQGEPEESAVRDFRVIPLK